MPEKFSPEQSKKNLNENLVKFTHWDAPPEMIEKAKSIIKNRNIKKSEIKSAEITDDEEGTIAHPGDSVIYTDGKTKPVSETDLHFNTYTLSIWREDGHRDIYLLE